MIARSLTELANLHGTDKGTLGPSAGWVAHNYSDVYEGYLERYRPQPIKILEIGLGVMGPRWNVAIAHGRNRTGGASLKMWYDYFPNATIYGIDVNPASQFDNDRIHTFVADQGNSHDLDRFIESLNGARLDIIVDDGSHRAKDQQVSLSYLFHTLRAGGLYFIEDLLANGLGDRATKDQGAGSVRSTRSVLKLFRRSGRFAEPNAFIDSAYLAEQIVGLNFHVPQKVTSRAGIGGVSEHDPRKRVIHRYAPDSEKLCVIRKKVN